MAVKGSKGTWGVKGPAHYRWNQGRKNTVQGHTKLYVPGHPRADSSGYVYEHVVVAEKALGRYLSEPAVVHHRDLNPANNDPGNLVICQDEAYHRLLHQRLRAYRACGHAGWRRCRYCKTWDDPANLSVIGNTIYHKSCSALHSREVRRGANR